MALDENGRIVCAAEDLRAFLDHGQVLDKWGNEKALKWWHVHRDGTFSVDDEPDPSPTNWPVPLMAWPGRAWIDLWGGDLQKPVDTQIQPLLDRIGDYFRAAGDGVDG